MRLSTIVASVLLSTTAMASSAAAIDCGQPPVKGPKLVAYSAGMTTATVTALRDKVIKYSANVDTYITCMDREGDKLIAFMGKAQQARRDEDLDAIHETRRLIQVQVNDLIRAYRAASRTQ